VVDLLRRKAILYVDDLGTRSDETDIPAEMAELVERTRQATVEAIVETDDELMARYLEGEEIEVEALGRALRQATVTGRLVPVLCGSSFRNKGVQPLLDAVVDSLPSPLDLPPVEGTHPDSGQALTRELVDEAPLAAFAFKIQVDPYVGKLCYLRVYSGVLRSGTYVYNANKRAKERIGRILRMHANHREDVEAAASGDIVAAVGLRQTVTGDTLCAEEAPILLEAPQFPEPVISQSIEPKTKADQDKRGGARQRLAEEDPTFRVRVDAETGQTLIAGMGELHLEIIVDRLLREFKVEANVGRPQGAYRETIRRKVQAEGRFIRQTGGRGQYGHVWLELEPLAAGTGFEFVNKIVGRVVPKEYIPAVEAGVREAMQNGVLAGYPVVDVRVTLFDGSYHEVDSSEMAFKVAASMAFKEAARKAEPVLLEPIMSVEVVTPEEFLGDVIGNLNARRGHVEGMERRGNTQVVRARVPLATMFGYATDLRSMTQGRATYTMQFSHYEEVPANIAQELLARV
ncbi:MAG: elongation factor G, partial [Firmicutes bacterium]|nr:elongation factor G [Bacillota bacterium]